MRSWRVAKLHGSTTFPRKWFSSIIEDVPEGKIYSLEHTFHQQDVTAYSELCGDSNPIHTHETAAKSAGFNGCVVHGMLCASLFPAIIASCLPGATLETKTIRFKQPVLVGECLRAEAKVRQVQKANSSLRIEFGMECYKGKNKVLVIEGNSMVTVPLSSSSWCTKCYKCTKLSYRFGLLSSESKLWDINEHLYCTS